MALYDRDLRLQVVSPRFLETFQATEAEVIGRTLHELTSRARKRFVRAVERALTGETVVRREDQRCTTVRAAATPCAGRPVPGATPKARSSASSPTWTTSRRLSEARREARANARRLRVALGAAQAGVYEIDHAGKGFWGSPGVPSHPGPPGHL